MKVIFLNTWNGKMKDAIAEFIKQQSADTDIFCFQEVYKDMEQYCKEWLPDYEAVAAFKYVGAENDFPQATYVRKGIRLLSSEPVLKERPGTGLGLYIAVQTGPATVHICNVHGTAKPGDKLDTPERIEQSRGLIDFLKDKKGPRIVGGDFNLLPETKSICMFSEDHYRDLIKDSKVRTTRNQLAWASYPDKQYYSDYVFVSPEVDVKSFSVPENEISDHLPMILEIGV